MDSSKPEVITNRTKMHATFKDSTTFLAAWLMYVSIRTSFTSEYGPCLTFWTAQLLQYVALSYPWASVLNYAIAYFQSHQKSPTRLWYEPDGVLFTNYLATAVQRSSAAPATSRPLTRPTTPLSQQICNNWNRESGCTFKERTGTDCGRKHICSNCKSSSHRFYQCPSKPAMRPMISLLLLQLQYNP